MPTRAGFIVLCRRTRAPPGLGRLQRRPGWLCCRCLPQKQTGDQGFWKEHGLLNLSFLSLVLAGLLEMVALGPLGHPKFTGQWSGLKNVPRCCVPCPSLVGHRQRSISVGFLTLVRTSQFFP